MNDLERQEHRGLRRLGGLRGACGRPGCMKYHAPPPPPPGEDDDRGDEMISSLPFFLGASLSARLWVWLAMRSSGCVGDSIIANRSLRTMPGESAGKRPYLGVWPVGANPGGAADAKEGNPGFPPWTSRPPAGPPASCSGAERQGAEGKEVPEGNHRFPSRQGGGSRVSRVRLRARQAKVSTSPRRTTARARRVVGRVRVAAAAVAGAAVAGRCRRLRRACENCSRAAPESALTIAWPSDRPRWSSAVCEVRQARLRSLRAPPRAARRRRCWRCRPSG